MVSSETSAEKCSDDEELDELLEDAYYIGDFKRVFHLSKLRSRYALMKITGFQYPITVYNKPKEVSNLSRAEERARSEGKKDTRSNRTLLTLPSIGQRVITESSSEHGKTMEKEGSSIKNLLSFYNPSYAPDDPSMNVSVYSSGVSKLSPYLSVDPYVSQEPEFILPEGASRQRGRFEFAFGTIGSGAMIGGALGAMNGLYTGVKATQGMTGKVRRTQLINYMSKQGSTSANALGIIAVMYSGFGCFFSWLREADDDANTLAAATATGLLYKSSAGLRRCAVGGGLGFALSAAYCLWRRGDKDRSIVNYVGNQYLSR